MPEPREIKSPMTMFNRDSKRDGVVDWRPNPIPSDAVDQSRQEEAPDPKGSFVLASAESSEQIAALQAKHFGMPVEETLAELDSDSPPVTPATIAPAGRVNTPLKAPAFSTPTS
jgi:hypothetical protein